ncbi:YbbR-like domain-containing protein [Cohnella suwonensis]|uniref:YbbR-like domain-containing protein n=1 Tax=Cohnella suwonensis TaxID=696072 RepID=A0ABW0LYF0_9BACL
MDRWLNHPTASKLVALGLALLMWAVVHFDPDEPSPNNVTSLNETKVIDDVIVQAYGMDEKNYVLLSLEPQKVKLTVRGTRSALASAQPNEYRLKVDLRTVGEGQHTLPLVEDLPPGITSVSMSPSTVVVDIEALQIKEFEVAIQTQGAPAKGYKVGTPILMPGNRVHVKLPKSQLEKVDRVGATISVEGEKETIKNKSVKLAAYDKDGNPFPEAVIDPAVLEVEVPITNPFKTVPLQLKLVGHMKPGLSIASFKPDVEQVTVYGPQEALDTIEFVEANIQLDALTASGKVTVPLIIAPPLIEVSPAKAEVTVEVLLSATRTLEGLPITLSGLGEGLKATITDPAAGKADISIQGAPALLDRLSPGDVDVIADLSGRGPGIYTIPLIVNLEKFMELAGGTQNITVEIVDAAPASTSPDEGNANGSEGTPVDESGQ